MPCNSSHMEPTAREISDSAGIASQLKHLADELTYSSDVLREYLLGNVDHAHVMKHVNRNVDRALTTLGEKARMLYVKIPVGLFEHVSEVVEDYRWLNAFVTRESKMKPADFEKVTNDQIEHRKEDLARLMKKFAEAGDIAKLRLVLDATPNGPLAPQLGFDPDFY